MQRGGILLLLLLVVISALVHAILHLVDLRLYAVTQNLKFRPMDKTSSGFRISNLASNLFWFIQLSDLHISKFNDQERSTDLRRFCELHVPIIRPDLVIVSGDLTDGKHENTLNSMQYIEEWKTYSKILKDTNVLEITKWLDVRGNHDTFNVPALGGADNLFSQYSAQGLAYLQSYMLTHKKPFGTYSFIGMDVCPDPGVKRPLNFFGIMTTKTARLLDLLSQRAKGSNQTFWFGHYPTSTIISPGFDVRATIGKSGFAYFCGHLHTLISKMYGIQPQGFLELELGDWRQGRFLRIVAVDHDLVSFHDTQLSFGQANSSDWPLLLITNPKHAGFLLPHKEPVHRIVESTHIRILAWSDRPIRKVAVSIDGHPYGIAVPASSEPKLQSEADGPLYVLPWHPEALAEKDQFTEKPVHSIEVTVQDVEGKQRTIEQPFVLDGNPRWNFLRLSSFAIHTDHALNLRLLFYSVWLFVFALLTLPRLLRRFFNMDKKYQHWFKSGMYRISNYNPIFYPLLFYLLYELCGPIFIGYLLDIRIGMVFIFGMYVGGTFLPDATTYLHEVMQMLIFTYPFLLVLVWRAGHLVTAHRRRGSDLGDLIELQNSADAPQRPPCNSTADQRCNISLRSICPFVGRFDRCSLVLLILLSLVDITFILYTVSLPFGLLATVISPGRLGLLILAWYCMAMLGGTAYIVPKRPICSVHQDEPSALS